MRENLIGRMLNDPSVRTWVKVKYRECLERDPVDALEDAKLLTVMLRERMDEIRAENSAKVDALMRPKVR